MSRRGREGGREGRTSLSSLLMRDGGREEEAREGRYQLHGDRDEEGKRERGGREGGR